MRPIQSTSGRCSVEGCERRRKTAGYCGAHYWRWRTHGDPGPAEITTYRERLRRRYVKSKRHTLEVDFLGYQRELAEERRAGVARR